MKFWEGGGQHEGLSMTALGPSFFLEFRTYENVCVQSFVEVQWASAIAISSQAFVWCSFGRSTTSRNHETCHENSSVVEQEVLRSSIQHQTKCVSQCYWSLFVLTPIESHCEICFKRKPQYWWFIGLPILKPWPFSRFSQNWKLAPLFPKWDSESHTLKANRFQVCTPILKSETLGNKNNRTCGHPELRAYVWDFSLITSNA